MASEEDKKPEVALYIGSLAAELARLAKNNEFDELAYILDMARLEADQVSKRRSGADGVDSNGSR